VVLNLDIRADYRSHFGFDKSQLERRFTDLLTLANITEGDFQIVATSKRAKRQRGKPEMVVRTISSDQTVWFAVWLTDKTGRRIFVDCELCSSNRYKKHGVLEQMKSLEKRLNAESENTLAQLQKFLEDDKENLRRLLTKMRDTKRKIRVLEMTHTGPS
jgi:hypothetical protein